jgi:hypothetical protein
LEVRAHQSYARGYLEIELGRWQEAFTTFSEVVSVFTEFKTASNNSLLAGFCDNICADVTPLLTFCQFNLGVVDVPLVDPSVRERVRGMFNPSADPTRVRQLMELSWRGRVTPIIHEALRTRMGTIADLLAESHKPGAPLAVFDRIITELHSARQTIRTVSQGDSEELKTIDDYCAWNQFLARVERSRMVLGSYQTAAERAEHAGKTLASISAQREQLQNDSANEFANDSDKSTAIALELAWRAVKVFHIAEGRRGPEAIGLLGRARKYCEEALTGIANAGVVDPPGLKDWVVETLTNARRARITLIALESGVSLEVTGKGADVLFMDDLESFSSCVKLVDLPPKPQIVLPKSVMFNLAKDEEYIPYPSLDGKRGKKSWFRFF